MDLLQALRRESLKRKEKSEELEEHPPKYATSEELEEDPPKYVTSKELDEDPSKYVTSEERMVTTTLTTTNDELDVGQENLQNLEGDINVPEILRGYKFESKGNHQNLEENELQGEGANMSPEMGRLSSKLTTKTVEFIEDPTTSSHSYIESRTSVALSLEPDRGFDVTSEEILSNLASVKESEEEGTKIVQETQTSHQLTRQPSIIIASVDGVHEEDHSMIQEHEDSEDIHEEYEHESHDGFDIDDECCRFEDHTHKNRCVACRERRRKEWIKKHSYLKKGDGEALRYREPPSEEKTPPNELEDAHIGKSQSKDSTYDNYDENVDDEFNKQPKFSYDIKDENFADHLEESDGDDQFIHKNFVDDMGDFHREDENSSSDGSHDEENSRIHCLKALEGLGKGSPKADSYASRHSKKQISYGFLTHTSEKNNTSDEHQLDRNPRQSSHS